MVTSAPSSPTHDTPPTLPPLAEHPPNAHETILTTIATELREIRRDQDGHHQRDNQFQWVTIGIAILGLVFMVDQVRDEGARVEARVNQVGQNVLATKFVIELPAELSLVDQTGEVKAYSPFPALNHYVVVTSPLGDVTVQDSPVMIDATGVARSVATYGEATVGGGRPFNVRLIATRLVLSPGALTSIPDDAIWSSAANVVRRGQ